MIAGLFAMQVPSVIASKGYFYKSRAKFTGLVGRESSNLALAEYTTKGLDLIPLLTARILLCKRLPDAHFIGRFRVNPICLKSGNDKLGPSLKAPFSPLRSVQYHSKRKEFANVVDALGATIEKGTVQGIIIMSATSLIDKEHTSRSPSLRFIAY